MTESPVFEWACALLEREARWSRLQARGTVRLVVRDAGLDTRTLRAPQLRVIALRLLPKELRSRGVDEVDALCAALSECPGSVEAEAKAMAAVDPEEVFKRLGRRGDRRPV
jgi:hypothetical protein